MLSPLLGWWLVAFFVLFFLSRVVLVAMGCQIIINESSCNIMCHLDVLGIESMRSDGLFHHCLDRSISMWCDELGRTSSQACYFFAAWNNSSTPIAEHSGKCFKVRWNSDWIENLSNHACANVIPSSTEAGVKPQNTQQCGAHKQKREHVYLLHNENVFIAWKLNSCRNVVTIPHCSWPLNLMWARRGKKH